ncbi:MAG: RNB domain-containing ribonuclease, partial [Ornithinibacter sp.]
LPDLPDLMRASDQRARAAERACADATEAAVLHGRVGEVFDAVVVDRGESTLEVQLVDLPVLTRLAAPRSELGASVRVRVVRADVAPGTLELALD